MYFWLVFPEILWRNLPCFFTNRPPFRFFPPSVRRLSQPNQIEKSNQPAVTQLTCRSITDQSQHQPVHQPSALVNVFLSLRDPTGRSASKQTNPNVMYVIPVSCQCFATIPVISHSTRGYQKKKTEVAASFLRLSGSGGVATAGAAIT